MKTIVKTLVAVLVTAAFASGNLSAQSHTWPDKKEVHSTTGSWFGFYTKYNFNDRWSYYGEYHLRRRNGIKDMGQIYLRLGATYKVAKYLELTLGIVNPYYWAPNQNDPGVDKVVPQYRLWQQAVLATPFKYVKALHQFRTEQRYARSYTIGSPFELTYRFRYKLSFYIPLNKRELKAKTLFLSLYEEIFMQTGKSIVYNHFEDNRAFIGLGYKFNETWQVQAGYMNTYRHSGAPWLYESRHIFRLNLFHQMDLKKDIQPKVWDVPLN